MKQKYIPSLLCGVSFFLGCSSSRPTVQGFVYDIHGKASKGTVVSLVAIDDRGNELTTLSTTTSDSVGHYYFLPDSALGSNLIVDAALSTGHLRNIAFSKGETDIHPLSEAMVATLLKITGPSAGVSLSDASADQLQKAITAALKLDSSSIDLTDSDATRSFLLSKEGREIAAAFTSQLTLITSSALDPTGVMTGSTFSIVDPCALTDVSTFSSTNFTFDITPEGSVCTGYTPSVVAGFSNGYRIRLLNDTFTFNSQNEFPTDEPSAMLQDSRTVVLGPFAATSGVTWTRKIFVPSSGDIVRFVEILNNPTMATQSTSFEIYGGLATSVATVLAEIGEGSSTLKASDRFAATAGNFIFNPTVGHVWQDNNGISAENLQFAGLGDPSAFSWQYTGVTLAAGEQKTFVSYAYLTVDRDPTTLRSTLTDLVEHPNMDQLSSGELSTLQNFAASKGNVCASEGSVVPGSTVTVTNTTKNVSTTTKARSDWGYCAGLAVSSGDAITVTATDGYSASGTAS